MLNSMADVGSEANSRITRVGDSIMKKRQSKGGIAVQDLGYNVIFTGGERTLEKNPEMLDVQRFDLEADPLFRQRTGKFDGGMLLNSIFVDRGLVTQLDSELSEASR